MRTFQFHRAAFAEASAAASHYAAIRWAVVFTMCWTSSFARSAPSQIVNRVFDPPARRHFRAPFPYAIVYLEKSGIVWIVAVMHFKQRPGYWKGRLA